MGKRALHRAQHNTSSSSLHLQAPPTPPPPPPPPPPLPPPLPPYPSGKCGDNNFKFNESQSNVSPVSAFCDKELTCSSLVEKKVSDKQFIMELSNYKCEEDSCSYRDNFHSCNPPNLMLQSQIQHLLIENCKNSNSVPSLDQLLLDSSKLGISQSELHRILSQHLAKCKQQPSSPKFNNGREFSGNCNLAERNIDKVDDARSRDSDLQVAELSISLDSWKPNLISSENNNNHALSMPELTHQSTMISSYRTKTKGNLSVRFENEEEEEDGNTSENNNRFESRRHQRSKYRKDDDTDSYCSTCSSSSSSDDPTVYQLPSRRTYAGGARISYVPNDTLALVKRQQQSLGTRSPHKKSNDDKNCIIS